MEWYFQIFLCMPAVRVRGEVPCHIGACLNQSTYLTHNSESIRLLPGSAGHPGKLQPGTQNSEMLLSQWRCGYNEGKWALGQHPEPSNCIAADLVSFSVTRWWHHFLKIRCSLRARWSWKRQPVLSWVGAHICLLTSWKVIFVSLWFLWSADTMLLLHGPKPHPPRHKNKQKNPQSLQLADQMASCSEEISLRWTQVTGSPAGSTLAVYVNLIWPEDLRHSILSVFKWV